MNKKELLKQIQLYSTGASAGDPPPSVPSPNPAPAPSKGGYDKAPPVPGAKAPPPTSFSGGYVAPSNNIAKMQQAMIDLSRAVMQDAHSSTMFRKQQDAKTTPAAPAVDESKKAFNDFIAEQYIGTLPQEQKGVEWTTDAKKTSFPQKKEGETDIYELDVVLDTLRRIGLPQSELKTDGNWEFRTNNGLKNIMGFAYSLLQVEGDFGFTNRFFNKGQLDKFQRIMSNITISDKGNLVYNTEEQPTVPLNVRNAKAAALIPILDGIKKMYQQFRLHVTGNPEYRFIIENKKPFESYNKSGTSPQALTRSETESLEGPLKGAVVHGVQYTVNEDGRPKGMKNIPLSALKSKEAYLAWMKHNGLNEAAAIRVFNDHIKPQIENLQG